jgi:two-component system cell cycle response regulator
MKRRTSTVQVIDSLAEITRYQDKVVLEKSMVSTLGEIVPSSEIRLYKVLMPPPGVELLLLAHYLVNADARGEDHSNPKITNVLSEGIAEAVETGSVVEVDDDRKGVMNIIYPVYDNKNDIFAVLVQFTDSAGFEDQRLVFGLLKVYANYLTLLEDNQKDKLTGLLNRETLNKQILKLLMDNAHNRRVGDNPTARRSIDSFTHWLGVLDVDHFKTVNDKYGHLYGDEVLILLARLLGEVFRQDDLIYRYGGEEFVVIIRVLNKADAIGAFERLRRTIEQHQFPQIEKITASIGLTEIGEQAGCTEVIENADRALYYAKANGRNQLHIYEDLVEQGLLTKAKVPDAGDIDLF